MRRSCIGAGDLHAYSGGRFYSIPAIAFEFRSNSVTGLGRLAKKIRTDSSYDRHAVDKIETIHTR
jgi:hypothetical protein